MAIIIDENKRVLVQGITGREGRARTTLMKNFGTNVIAGCTPGKGGQEVLGVPVFNHVAEAVQYSKDKGLGDIDISVLFVPARGVKGAAIEAIEAGVKFLVIVPDRVPLWDAMEIAKKAKEYGAQFVGPNTLGVLSPGHGVLGMIGGRADSAKSWFKPGYVGIISRSGGMTSSCGYYLGQAGVGLSTLVHVGGDQVLGVRIPDAALLFEKDPDTKAIVIFGEIGGSQEEQLAELMQSGKVTKPVIAYIGGKAAKEGTRFSHAGAIIEGGKGTHDGKVNALKNAGATVVDAFGDLPDATVQVLKKAGIPLVNEAKMGGRGGLGVGKDTNPNAWTTAVTEIKPNHVAVRGYNIADLMGNISFGQTVYLILRGEMPTPAVGKVMDAILVSSIDHGATPPSALAARTVASTGASLSASVGAGIMSINQHHGGAIENCARTLAKIIAKCDDEQITLDDAAEQILTEEKAAGRRVSGFGHRYHTNDPRAGRLFEITKKAGVAGRYVEAAEAVQRRFAVAGKKLPINVDGAAGAVLADLGFDPAVLNGLFMIARTSGLVAHVIEEKTRMKPMRKIDPIAHSYDGKTDRKL